MRDNFHFDWAFAAQSSLERVVQERFPQDAYRWPVLRQFNLESCMWQSTHLILILKDKLSGIPAGGDPEILDDPAAPQALPDTTTITAWHTYIRSKWQLKQQDMVMILPAADVGPTVDKDWEQWTQADKDLWATQLEINATLHFYTLKGLDVAGDFFVPPGLPFSRRPVSAVFRGSPTL
ncbi:MAG: hypothetical protein M3454_02910 [Actinomycetota bacterium]|nr:hypothetical protein [Actinomycetota bacterium]